MPDADLGRARERLGLLLVVVVAIAVRVIGYDGLDTPRWWFAQTSTLWAERAFDEGRLWEQWLALLGRTDAPWVHQSPRCPPSRE